MWALVVEALVPNYAGLSIRHMPVPGSGEVLVKVRAAAVNFPDLLQTHGDYQHRPALPFGTGMEAAGEVVAVGKGSSFIVGDRVLVQGAAGGGGRGLRQQAGRGRDLLSAGHYRQCHGRVQGPGQGDQGRRGGRRQAFAPCLRGAAAGALERGL